MGIIKTWLLLFGILCSTLFLSGQENISFQHLSKKDGLSQASVFAIAQDDTGFMWFGTRDGLNKYDGYQFKVYKKSEAANSLVANDIRHLYFDPQKKELWIGTNAGLGKYQSITDDFQNFLHVPINSNSISNNVIRQIFRDSKGRLWVGTAVGLNLLDEKTNRFQRFYFSDNSDVDPSSNDVKAISEDHDGTIWFGTANGLYTLSEIDNTFRFERFDDQQEWQLSDTHIKILLKDKKENYWIGTFNGGVNFWDREKNEIFVYRNEENIPTSLSHNNIRSMCLDQNENLWVGTFDGLNYLEKGKTDFTRYTKSEFGAAGLSDKSIRSVFQDKRGSLWIGTYYGGINHLDKHSSRFINVQPTPTRNGLSGNVVSSFAEDELGNLWIGTEGDGLNLYNRQKKAFKSYQFVPGQANTLSGNNVKQLLLDGDKLWIGTFQAGLNAFDLKTEAFTHFRHDPSNKNSLAANNVYGLRKEGNHLWILTYGGGLDILDLTTNTFYNYTNHPIDPNSLSSELTRVFLETANKNLWIGTEKGLNQVIKNDQGFPERFKVFLPKEKIYSLQEDQHQTIWIGTFTNGLFHFDPKKQHFEHFTTADGLPGNTVFGILEVSEEELWLSTNNGLSKLNPKQKKFTNYNYSNGLENSEYNFNAYFKTSDGLLLFGGTNGYTQFDPSAIQANHFIPPIAFTELKKNNQVVTDININQTETITFNYNEANFTLRFAALDYLSPENNHYAFMLEGIDRDWNYSVGETEATYTIQREGTYTFRLKGGNSDGVWNPKERQLSVIVLPPPYRTWWAYLIYLIILGITIFGLMRFVRLRHKLQLEQLDKQKQEELHEVKIRFFTNITHEFRTPLTLILGPLQELIAKEQHTENIQHKLSAIEKSAQRLLNLVNQVLTFRKLATDHEPMEIVNNNLVHFLEEIFLPFQETAKLKNINYHFQSSAESLSIWYDPDKLEKVFFNLLSNAFKFTPEGGTIKLSIEENKTNIDVKVSDSGPGIDPKLHQQVFKRFYEKNSPKRSAIKGTGIGLAISKQMVELHGGKIFVAPGLPNTKGKVGTSMVVQIPKGKNHFKGDVIIKDTLFQEHIMDYTPIIPSTPDTTAINDSYKLSNLPKEDRPLLLIVEDNPEVRAYIEQVFQDDYRIISAEHGIEGLQKAKKALPNLIISDVMMPQMDGITFCKKIKTDIEVSHIPIILLTARTASLFKIEGLKKGADDYVTKPFHPEELKLRVHNIIQARQDARDRFARVLTIDPKEISITSADEVFLEKALQIVEDEMENYEFNVNQFAYELAVSRPLLFTKLKALTGQTPNNFIKTIRLKRAAQLIKTKKINISEVAYKVGFKDPKYFRKCFKAQFNMLPSEFENSNIV
jgi:ligand-binding sensor domain-containing protein/signal transduction histidine kinase/DNA-binding response OmpR family regulator